MIGGGPFRLKAGEWTDDTSMALCLADSLIANGGILEPTDLRTVIRSLVERRPDSVTAGQDSRPNPIDWLRGPYHGGGALVRRNTAGNGGVMRLAPVVLAAKGDSNSAASLARNQSRVTNAAVADELWSIALDV
jgi:ADP-ribosyl-[dinitrogen reductase] hydrolase